MTDKNETTYASQGMLFGVALAGGLGVIIFALTNQPVFIAFAGVGAGVGLALGAGMDRAKRRQSGE